MIFDHRPSKGLHSEMLLSLRVPAAASPAVLAVQRFGRLLLDIVSLFLYTETIVHTFTCKFILELLLFGGYIIDPDLP